MAIGSYARKSSNLGARSPWSTPETALCPHRREQLHVETEGGERNGDAQRDGAFAPSLHVWTPDGSDVWYCWLAVRQWIDSVLNVGSIAAVAITSVGVDVAAPRSTLKLAPPLARFDPVSVPRHALSVKAV